MDFDGSTRKRTVVSLRGKSKEEDAKELLRRARAEREARAAEKRRAQAAATVLRFYRQRSAAGATRGELRAGFDRKASDLGKLRALLAAAGKPLPTPAAAVMEPLAQALVQFYDPAFPGDAARLALLARLLLDSCRSGNPQWNYLGLRRALPGAFYAEALRLVRLCLHRVVVVGAATPQPPPSGAAQAAALAPEEEQALLLDLVEALTALPAADAGGEASEAATAWRVLLGLAVEEGDASSPLPRMAVGGGAGFQARLRREMGLPSLLRAELAKAAATGAASRALGVVWRLAATAAGVPLAAAPASTATAPALLPAESAADAMDDDGSGGRSLQAQQRRAAGQLARALLGTPRLLTAPALAPVVAPLRQGGGQGLWWVLAAWDGQQQQPATAGPEAAKDGGEAAALVRAQNLLELARLLLQQPPAPQAQAAAAGEAAARREMGALVRALEYSVCRVPLVFWGDGGGGDPSGSGAAGAVQSPMELDEEDEEDGFGASAGGGTGATGEGGVTLEGAIQGALRERARAGRGADPAAAYAALGALRELCGGRELPRLFDRLLPAGGGAAVEDEDAVLRLCGLCSHVLVHATGAGGGPGGVGGGGEGEAMAMQVLNLLAYHATGPVPFVARLWAYLEGAIAAAGGPRRALSYTTGVAATATAATAPGSAAPPTTTLLARLQPALYLLCAVYAHQLLALDDEEFFRRAHPLPLARVVPLVETLRHLLYLQYWADPARFPWSSSTTPGGLGWPAHAPAAAAAWGLPTLEYLQLARAATALFNGLYQRHTRRPFPQALRALAEAGEGAGAALRPVAIGSGGGGGATALENNSLWHWPALTQHELDQETSAGDPDAMIEGAAETGGQGGGASIESVLDTGKRLYAVLTRVPQVLPFAQRVQVFQRLLASDKRQAQDEAALYGHRIRVRRSHIYEDAFAGMNHLGRGLRGRVQVTLLSELGTEEAGIDGGGVFKEFMDTLARRAFDPQYALFRATPEHLLYPNPLSALAVGGDHLQHFEFVGRVLAKALYESILVEPQFALFFLQRLAGKLNETDDLHSLDPELYRHLMGLKRLTREGGSGAAGGDSVADLCLNFEVVTGGEDEGQQVAELVPGGKHVAVTNANVFRYIQLVANHRLNVEINAQAQAFLHGFRDLIPSTWLRMFGAEELSILLAGEKRAIDMEDLRAHTRYSGGYHPSQPIIQWLWDALRSFTPDQQAAFLMFVTSCSRQPLLGFCQLNPPLCVQKIPLQDDRGEGERLPSAATCMNLLKLPAYTSPESLREKLLYAITAGAGFELS